MLQVVLHGIRNGTLCFLEGGRGVTRSGNVMWQQWFCSVCMVNIRRKNAKNPKVSEKYVVFVTNVPIRDTRQYVARWGGGGWEIETGIN